MLNNLIPVNLGNRNNVARNANMMNAVNLMLQNGGNNGVLGNAMMPNNIGNMGPNTNVGINMKCRLPLMRFSSFKL